MNIIKNNWLIRKFISYSIITLLVLNLFSGISGGKAVFAAPEEDIGVSVIAETDMNGENIKILKITYQVTNAEAVAGAKLYWTVKKDGNEGVWSNLSLPGTGEIATLTEDGSYTIEYYIKRADNSESSHKSITEVLDNTDPEVEIGNGTNYEKTITIRDSYLGADCCKLLYKKKSLNELEVVDSTGEYIVPMPDEAGEYKATINIKSIMVNLGDGIYSDFVVKVTDLGGNTKEESVLQGENIVIDNEAPKISVKVVKENGEKITVDRSSGAYYYNESYKELLIQIADLQLREPNIYVKKDGDIIDPKTTTDTSLSENLYIKEIEYSLNGDGKYEININAKDIDNRSSQEERVFVIDTTKPSFGTPQWVLSYANGNALPEARNENGVQRYYLKNPAKLSFSIAEANFETAEVSVYENSSLAELYTMDGNPYNFFREYTSDGEYNVYATAKDKAGNEATCSTAYFVIDQVAPSININGITNNQMVNGNVSLDFEATDKNHDYENYVVTIKRSDLNGTEESRNVTYTENEWINLGNDKVHKNMTLQEEGIYDVTFKASDKAGNTSTKTVRFYIDHSAPEISHLTYSDVNGMILPKYNNIYSNKVIAVEFDVFDSYVGVDSNKVYVTIGTVADRMAGTPVYIAHKLAGNRYVAYVPADFGLSEFTDTITIWANDKMQNEGHYTSDKIIYTTDYSKITMTCDKDYTHWGNEDITFHTRIEDSKAGIRKIVYKVNDKVVKTLTFDNPVYAYDYDITATESALKVTGYPVEVEVTNNCGTVSKASKQVFIDKEKPKVQLSGVGNGEHYNTDRKIITTVEEVSYDNTTTSYVIKRSLEGKESGMSVSVFHSDTYKDVSEFTLLNEGIYEIYAVTTDGAGNVSVSNTLKFVIDKTAPKLGVTGIGEGTVSGKAVALDFSCEELYYDTNRVLISVERTLEGKTNRYIINGFPGVSKISTLRHTFSEDGTYKVTIQATDKAGNVAVSRTVTFTIDQTKPVIRIEGTTNYQLWNKVPNISFVVEESYYATNQVTITGTRTDMNGKVTDIKLPDFVSAGKISRLRQSFDKDGIYEFTITSKDRAGNTDSRTIHFTLDRTAPYINEVSQYEGGYYQEFRLCDDLDNIFKDLTVISYEILLNGVEYNGTDFITEEGKYNLYVKARDELGQETIKTAEFIIDHTAPKVIFTGVKDGESVHEKGNILLSLVNAEDEICGIRVNGEEVEPDIRSIEYSEYGSYRIEVDCVDKAGNAVTREIYFVYSNPYIIAIIGGGMGGMMLITFLWLWLRTRRLEKEEK
ncbi:MAG: Ig-like domain-containing protein [Lachnospiraceae bacterium]